MKVLFIGVNYSPEITGIAPYTTAMAQGLQDAGHQVKVITGIPHYPQWKNFTGFRGMRRTEIIDGVRVIRVRHFIGSGGMGLGRIAQEVTFGLGAVLTSWRGADVVVCVSPPLISTAMAVTKARVTRRPVGVWVQDLYSNGAREIGDNGAASKLLGVFEAATLRAANGVLVIHNRFKRHLVEDLGVAADKVTVSRNWSHLKDVEPADPETLRQEHFPEAEIVALHTGNMGAKQALENIVEAARLAEDDASGVYFGLVGDGSQREALEELGSDIDRLVFVPSLSDEEYAGILQAADVLLVNEKQGLRESAVPSKLTSYFVQSKPVVAATEADSATAEEVVAAGAGPIVPPGDPEALLKTVVGVAQDHDTARTLGQHARRYADDNLTASSAVARVSQWITRLANRG